VLWDLETDSKLYRTLSAIADELERVRQRGLQLMEETDPRTASETLEDWERCLSLPDMLIAVLPATLAGRRLAITQKYTSAVGGGQSYSFFAKLTLSCGYPLLSITTGNMCRVGARVGDRCFGTAFVFTLILTVSPAELGALTHAQLEAVVRDAAHAHIKCLFVYT
jgi:uncharacterized protein YmfQ (DUF2313 family)